MTLKFEFPSFAAPLGPGPFEFSLGVPTIPTVPGAGYWNVYAMFPSGHLMYVKREVAENPRCPRDWLPYPGKLLYRINVKPRRRIDAANPR